MDNINTLLTALENEIMNAKRPITNPSGKIVDEARIMSIINNIKSVMPTALIESEYIVMDRDKIIDQANYQAQEIINQANYNVSQKLNDSEIIRQAQNQANIIVKDAREYADFLKNDTAMELMKMLKFGEGAFANVLAHVRDYIEQVGKGNLDFNKNKQ